MRKRKLLYKCPRDVLVFLFVELLEDYGFAEFNGL